MKVEELGVPEEVRSGYLDAGSPRGTVAWTPLQFACALGDEELAEQILAQDEHQLHSVSKTKYSYSALHVATRFGQASIVDSLLKKGAMTTTPADGVVGASPLHIAVVQGNMPLVQRLLSAYPHGMPMTKNGTTPYELAKRLGHVEISQVLQDHEQRAQNKEQLGNWLASIGMVEYAPQFEEAGFEDVHFLLANGLTDSVLDRMKIEKPGHRMKLQSLYQLKEFLQVEDEDEAEQEEDDDDESSGGNTSDDEASEQGLEEDSSDEDSDED
ncbi:hypothetical protein Poli38472_001997 [Pythium oligandrum]|uniref:SAM domain-containing protein n=1 Tax=Pythium oligandrum TaxID=41045 RepID=A0A8K1FNW7_PYTOL|nr:hypothetical protein Poli38472_001997 [Pythium oligandrum]|eukprot:TMW69841.1 hypothetical protein Poli38472_001997 [Pythium oligandrum]